MPAAGAAVASVVVAWAAARCLEAAGGFGAHPLPFTLAPLGLLWTHAWLTGWGILELYGANFLGVHGWTAFAFAALHLTGLALAVAGTGIALRRFIRPAQDSQAPDSQRGTASAQSGQTAAVQPRRAADAAPCGEAGLVDSVLAVAVVVNLVSYLLSIEPGTVLGTGYDAREIAAVLPLGAVLAGRTLGPKLTAARLQTVMGGGGETCFRYGGLGFAGLALALAGYAVALGCSAAQGPAASGDEALARWLAGHGLRYGLGGASANVVSVLSGGRAIVAPVTVRKGRVVPLLYQSATAAYDPAAHDATFLVAGTPSPRPGDPGASVPGGVVRATFGAPGRVYRFAGYTIDVWDVNLLTKLGE